MLSQNFVNIYIGQVFFNLLQQIRNTIRGTTALHEQPAQHKLATRSYFLYTWYVFNSYTTRQLSLQRSLHSPRNL